MTGQDTRWNGHGQDSADRSASGDWPTLYAQYLLRAASQSAKSSELYQQIMEGVAQGDIAPTVFRDLMPTFAQTRGTDYATQLTELNTQFFSRQVELNASFWQELVELIGPETASLPAAPPAFDSDDPIRWYQQLTDYASHLNSEALAAYQALLDGVADGTISPDRLRQSSTAFLERRLPEHMSRLSAMYFDLLNGLNDLRSEYEEVLLRRVLATSRSANQDMPIALNLSGRLGETATASLTLTNTQPERANIRCAVTDLRRADGIGPAFVSSISVAPMLLSLGPGEEASLSVSLRLDDGLFEADVFYVGSVQITRRGEPRLDVPLRIKASAAEPVEKAAHRRTSRRAP